MVSVTGRGHRPRLLIADGQNLDTIEADGSLYRVNSENGTWSGVGKPGEWKGTIVGTMINGAIYTVEDSGALYETNPVTGLWKQIGKADFGKTQFLFGVAGSLYSIDDGDLYRINPTTGSRSAVGKSNSLSRTSKRTLLPTAGDGITALLHRRRI